jgi:hypothetical protein
MKTMSLLTGKVFDTAVQVLKENQIVIRFGHLMSRERYVVHRVVDAPGGFLYHLIDLDTKEFHVIDHPRPLREKFGIGWYYDDQTPEMMDAFGVAILRAQAQVKADREAEAKREWDERTERLKAAGRERLQSLIPANAQAVIVAEQREDDSDPMTDYYSHHTVRTVILGFSRHTRDLFAEMRKYAPNFEGTAHLAEENKDYEQREKYTGGDGYYLGGSGRNGWIVRKERIGDRERFIERFAVIAGDEDNIHVKAVPTRTAGSTETASETITGNFQITDYSDKAIAVFGDTRAVKDELKALGGRFNPKLSHEGEKRAGWIFQKVKEQELKELLAIN